MDIEPNQTVTLIQSSRTALSFSYTQRAQEFISSQDCRQTYYVLQNLCSVNSLRNTLQQQEGKAVQLQAIRAFPFLPEVCGL